MGDERGIELITVFGLLALSYICAFLGVEAERSRTNG
jgi:hypothetical protein